MAKIDVKCRFCQESHPVIKHGKHPCGSQRYRCLTCRKTFSLDYKYEACKPGVKEKIVEMAMNNAGVRDTGRVLKIGTNTVLRVLKNAHQAL